MEIHVESTDIKIFKLRTGILVLLLFFSFTAASQNLAGLEMTDSIKGLAVRHIRLSDSSIVSASGIRPLFSFDLDDSTYSSDRSVAIFSDGSFNQNFGGRIEVTTRILPASLKGWMAGIVFKNTGMDTVSVSNIIPFGPEGTTAYIAGAGPWDLARAYLFRPGYLPLRVVLPDNAWELGYASFNEGIWSVCGLARRQQINGGQRGRYETILPPGATVSYMLYADIFTGEWQNGLRLMFRDRYLYDLEEFDNSLFEREDLKWIKNSYIVILQMAWDREFYDRSTGKYTYPEELRRWNQQFGFVDVFGIWPTWPRLGLDQRNQWDMYRDLPGGTEQIRNFARLSRQYGTRFFIAYNPWDNSTRKEDHLRGMAQLIEETEADGVVLDTRGSSSYELQAAADSVREGVVMFSEGMAVTRDMPGIIAGRVHNAIYFSPELNLNKLIKPDFSIFRVCDVGEDRNHREIAIAFFNGYGSELNLFRPGGRDNEGYNSDLDYLARTTFILRQNNDAFLDNNWTPLIDTETDRAYVNKWSSGDKTVFTVLNMNHDGLDGILFRDEPDEDMHYVSLWTHEYVTPVREGRSIFIPVEAEGWNDSFSSTRLEGSVNCIARLPVLIDTHISGDSLFISKRDGGGIKVWKGNPSFQSDHFELDFKKDTVVSVVSNFGYYEGKIVVQCLDGTMLRDERIETLRGGKPWKITRINRTPEAHSVPADMVLVPGAEIEYSLTTREDFFPYPAKDEPVRVKVDSFLIDRYPVTNSQYYDFLLTSGYVPADTTNFLKHWENGMFKQGQEKYPVVYVCYEDMEAYARWAGKRLPAEAEWQLAAQGTDRRKWPWGNEFRGTWCNNAFDRPTPVDAFSKGASPYGAIDMVGNIWQMTGDKYFNGINYMTVIRGGSYYMPESSSWYIQGGPQPLDRTQIMLMVSPGFDRSATVGFRCVKDIEPAAFSQRR